MPRSNISSRRLDIGVNAIRNHRLGIVAWPISRTNDAKLWYSSVGVTGITDVAGDADSDDDLPTNSWRILPIGLRYLWRH